MRRTVLLPSVFGLALALPGCVGFEDFIDNTMTMQANPNMPMGDSLNMRRVRGQQVESPAIAPQAGNVWPRGVEPMPTLQDIEGDRAAPARPPVMPRQSGSSAIVPPLAATTPATSAVMAPTMVAPAPLAAAPAPPATVLPTQTGPAVVTTGSDRYQTVSTPTGAAVVVPNGNGTATLMRSDGSMETVTLPR